MDISITEAQNRLPEMIRAVERGEQVIITRYGKRVRRSFRRLRNARRFASAA